MLCLLTTREDVVAAQKALKEIMLGEFHHVQQRDIAHRPVNEQGVEIQTDGCYWSQHSCTNVGTSRFVNRFGIITPEPKPLRIAVTVNVVPVGQNGRVQGFFAQDARSKARYLMHTGNIKGGCGVNGKAFREWLGKSRCEAQHRNDKCRSGYIVVRIDEKSPAGPLIEYIEQISGFREHVIDPCRN